MHLITNRKTGEKAVITRDVRTTHPDWVHEQCGTASEGELQAFLGRDKDHLNAAGIEVATRISDK